MTMNEIDPQEFGRLEAKVEAMEKTIEKMSRDLDQLVALANQGRGAFWIAMLLGGSIGAGVSALVSKAINFSGLFR